MNASAPHPNLYQPAASLGLWRRFASLPRWRIVVGGLLILISLSLAAIPWNTLKLLRAPSSEQTVSAVQLVFGLSVLESVEGIARHLALQADGSLLADQIKREIDRLQIELRRHALIDELFDQGEIALIEAERYDLERKVDRLRRELKDDDPEPSTKNTEYWQHLQSKLDELSNDLDRLLELSEKLSDLKTAPEAKAHPSTAGPSSQTLIHGESLNSRHSAPSTIKRNGLTIIPLTEGVRIELSPQAEESSANLKRRMAPMLQTGMGELSPTAVRTMVQRDIQKLLVASIGFVLTLLLWLLLILAHIFSRRATLDDRRAAVAESREKTESYARQLAEARLMVMRAQVEPHFLFNTLAHVQALQEIDPPQAGTMLERLIAYLRAAMPSMREVSSTLGREIDVVRAYLELIKIRMGERLDYSIEVPPELQSLPLPPTMIATLVENAIKHGLEPKREGGRLSIQASLSTGPAERLHIVVADDGLGLGGAATSGSGVGLANTRERLRMLYGNEAELIVEPNLPSGVRATLKVPTSVPETLVEAETSAGEHEEFSPLAIQTTLLLAVLAGWFGAHRFYVGRYRTGVLQALLGLLSIVSGGVPVFLLPLVVWLLLDLAWLLSREFLDREQRRLVRWRASDDPNQALASRRRRSARSADASPYSRALTLALAVLSGVVGGHRFYLGRTGSALAMLFTLGGLGLWWLIDILRAALGDLTDREGRRVTEWE